MGAIGGDIKEMSYSNDNVGSGTIYFKSGETSSFDLGGYTNELTVDGSGQPITKKTRKPWGFEGTVSADMNTRQDLENLQALADDLGETTFDITHSNGSVYSGVGTVVGDLKQDGNEATLPLTLMGGGKLVKQA